MAETLIFSKENKIPNNKKKLFIGQWLLLNKKKKIKDYKVLKYEETTESKIKEYEYIKKVYGNVLKNLTPILNKIHKKQYKENDWEILIFYSLVYFISTAYSKWKLIKKSKTKYNLLPIEIFSFKKNYFLKDDSQSFFTQMKTDEYDDWLFSKIIKAQNFKFHEKKISKNKKKYKDFDNIKKLKLQRLLFPKNNNKYFLINLALPKFLKLKLNLLLNKNLRVYNNIDFKKGVDISSKRNLFLSIKTKNKFEKFIYETLSEIFPRNFLENFEFIEKNISYLNWPKKPKVIFTSYEHYFNDVFKIYTINKKQDGAKFHILQHGHQGLNNMCLNYYEQKICNSYFNWGNLTKGNYKSLFCPTIVAKTITKNIKKDILLSYSEFTLKPWKFMPLPKQIDETNIYRDDIIKLLHWLNKDSTNDITLKYNTVNENQYTTNEIKKNFKKLNFIQTDLKKRGFEFSREYKLNIETTNSTGFLELLALNIPVILVTNKKFFDVKKEYKKIFEDLIKCNVIFFDPKKAADFIKLNINNISHWWLDELTQRRIKKFCNHVCKYEGSLNHGLSSLINQIK
mgnify:FL=1